MSLSSICERRIRFAIAGCGRVFQQHVRALQQHADDAVLVAVCDPDDAARARAAALTGVPSYDDYMAMLQGCDADVVVLATPSGLHAEQAILAARSGRHVVTEKPMATRWHDGLRMVRACDDAQVRLFVVKQNRCNPTLQLLRRAVLAGRFGRIYNVAINVFWQRPQSYYDSAAWRGTWEFDGGALMNQASHYVDLIDWLVGPVESVFAYTATLARDIEVEDSGVVAIKWRSGALGTLNVSMLTFPQNYEGSITIIGERGTARVGGVAVNRIEHWQFSEPHPDDAQVATASYETPSVYGRGHVAYYRNVIDCLRGRAPPEADGREGLRALELLVAAYKSARDGVKVSLPLEL